MKNNIETDATFRYGGEEFLILLRELNIEQAKKIGERIRMNLELEPIEIGNGKYAKVTVSCGLAQYPIHSEDVWEVIELADKALYKAKRKGKNNVVMYNKEGLKNMSLFLLAENNKL